MQHGCRLLPLIALLFTACASPTPADRIAGHAAAFASWPAEVQAKVRAGEIAPGFTETQVRVALGEPDRIGQHTTAQGEETIWIYRDRGPKFSFGLGVSGGGGHSGFGAGAAMTDRATARDEKLRVFFRAGLVTAIETTQR